MDNLPFIARRAVRRAESANLQGLNHVGAFFFDIAETEKRRDGFGIISMAGTTFYHAVPHDLIVVETLMLCHMIQTRSFAAGDGFGRWIKQGEFLSVLGLPVTELPE